MPSQVIAIQPKESTAVAVPKPNMRRALELLGVEMTGTAVAVKSDPAAANAFDAFVSACPWAGGPGAELQAEISTESVRHESDGSRTVSRTTASFRFHR
jgi:hypothetical protein